MKGVKGRECTIEWEILLITGLGLLDEDEDVYQSFRPVLNTKPYNWRNHYPSC